MRNNKKAIVLLSGGLDSATTLYFAQDRGFDCSCLIFDYGQRHRREIESAKAIAQRTKCKSQVIKINLPWKGSALLDKKMKVPYSVVRIPSLDCARDPLRSSSVPSTYVPGRNIIFLSFALSFAEAIKAERIFIGAHVEDYSGYPDCRPEFYQAFSRVIRTGTKAGVQERPIKIETPLIAKTKARIIRLGQDLGVPFDLTWSCYHGGKEPCARCASCYYRAKGFKEAGVEDPLRKK